MGAGAVQTHEEGRQCGVLLGNDGADSRLSGKETYGSHKWYETLCGWQAYGRGSLVRGMGTEGAECTNAEGESWQRILEVARRICVADIDRLSSLA